MRRPERAKFQIYSPIITIEAPVPFICIVILDGELRRAADKVRHSDATGVYLLHTGALLVVGDSGVACYEKGQWVCWDVIEEDEEE